MEFRGHRNYAPQGEMILFSQVNYQAPKTTSIFSTGVLFLVNAGVMTTV